MSECLPQVRLNDGMLIPDERIGQSRFGQPFRSRPLRGLNAKSLVPGYAVEIQQGGCTQQTIPPYAFPRAWFGEVVKARVILKEMLEFGLVNWAGRCGLGGSDSGHDLGGGLLPLQLHRSRGGS